MKAVEIIIYFEAFKSGIEQQVKQGWGAE